LLPDFKRARAHRGGGTPIIASAGAQNSLETGMIGFGGLPTRETHELAIFLPADQAERFIRPREVPDLEIAKAAALAMEGK
jgi:hypothetical protein